MIPQPTTWFFVEVGMYVQSDDGRAWRVDGKVPASEHGDGCWGWTLHDRAGQEWRLVANLEAPVAVMVPTMDEAENMVARALPVSEVHRRIVRMEELRTVPDTKWARAQLASHLLELHGESVNVYDYVAENVDDMEELLHLHAASHARPHTNVVPHVHVPFHEL